MTDCNETLKELQLYLDGELPASERDTVLEHLEECLDCFHAFDFQAELKAVIAAKCRNDVMPPDLLDRIRRCFDDGEGPGPGVATPPPDSDPAVP